MCLHTDVVKQLSVAGRVTGASCVVQYLAQRGVARAHTCLLLWASVLFWCIDKLN